jgi:multicomponent Na+:H+ antiporter subunit C
VSEDRLLLYLVTSIALLCVGLYALVVQTSLVRRILALNVMSVAVFVLLATVARRAVGEEADPVPHALVLTGIVVSVSVTAVAVSLARRIEREPAQETTDEENE